MPPFPYRRPLLLLTFLASLGLLLVGLPAQAQTGSISYTAAWAWGDAIDTPGPGWEVTNDLGYRVQVESGAVVLYSTQLIACEHEHDESVWQWLSERLGVAIGPATAYAGHGDEENPAEVMPVLVESLAEPETVALGSVEVSEPAWCQGHYLVARGAEGEMAGRSLEIAGTVTGPDGATAPFVIDTALAWGALADLRLPYDGQDASRHVETGDEAIEIVVLRALDALFDGVDFAGMDETEQAKAVLRNLAGGMAIVVVDGTVH